MSAEKNYAVDPESIIAHAIPAEGNYETNGQVECPTEKKKDSLLGKLLCCCGTLKLRKALTSASFSANRQQAGEDEGSKRPEKNGRGGADPVVQSARFFEGGGYAFLPRASPNKEKLVCLVVDLDETLVHSSFKHCLDADFVVPVEIESQVHQVYVKKRPHVDEFLKEICPLFECVLFTASLSKYADPVVDLLDNCHCFQFRLFRTSCTLLRGAYVKDLGRLGRRLNRVAILDNSPSSYQQHVENAIPIKSWFGDPTDNELLKLIEPLRSLAACRSIFDVLPNLVSSLTQSSFSMNNNVVGGTVASSQPVVGSPVNIVLGEISLFSMGNDFRLLLDSAPGGGVSDNSNVAAAYDDGCSVRKGRHQDSSAKCESPSSVSSKKTSHSQTRSSSHQHQQQQHETSFTSKHSAGSSASNARSVGRTRSHHGRSNRERSRHDADDGKRSAGLLLDASNLSNRASSSSRSAKSSKSFETIVVAPGQRKSTRTSSTSLVSTKLEFVNSGSIFSPTQTGNVSSIF